MNKTIRTSIFLFILSVQFLYGQGNSGAENRIEGGVERGPSLAALERKALERRAEGDYSAAMQYYAWILRGDSLHVQALRGYGEMALATSAPERAEWAFQRLVDNKLIGTDGLPLLRLADAKFRLGKYAEAQQVYRRFLYIDTPTGMTAEALKDAQMGLANAEWAQDLTENQSGSVTLIELDSIINTRRYSEYSPYPAGDTLWYSSYSAPFKGDNHVPQRHLIRVKQAIADGNSLAVSNVDFLGEPKQHTGQVTFNRSGDAMYYTVGSFVNAAEIRFEIFQRRKKKDNSWGPPVKLPAHVNMPGYTTTEPNVAFFTANEGKEVLLFVSDRPGGKGKRDIWFSPIQRDSMGRDTFLQPVNLDSLNTSEDDVTPFYHNRTQTLYFSTMGYPTLGGFDIYKAIGQWQFWSAAQNLGTAINGSANDVYYALNESGKTAFFASNRRGQTNYSEEACCYDLYQVNLVRPEMIAVTFNEETKDSLSKTEMQLFEITPDGPKSIVKIQVAGNNFPFPLDPGKKYMLVATKPYFEPDTVKFETPSVVWNDVLVQQLYLPPAKVNLVATVFDKESGKPLPGVTARFIDLGPIDPRMKPDTSTNAKGNRYDYKLDFNHRYKVVVQKFGYTLDSVEVTTEGLTTTTTIEKQLYLTRGINLEAVVFNEITKEPLNDVTFRLVEIPSGKTDEKTNPTGNDYHNTLGFEKRYKIIATRPGYSTDSLEFVTPDIASVDFVTLHKELYLRPLDLSAYLPFNLYFDNDEPDKRTLATSTKKLYSESYFAYYPRKQEFIDRYTEGLSGTARDSAVAELDQFFEQEVKGGWNRLRIFTEVLYDMLRRGEEVHITIRGHASPRAASSYNMRLTGRRISSIMNHFSDFESGYLNKYIESGQLVVTEEPTGENEAPKGIEDTEERGSIFSVKASRERRVEIIGVEIKR